MCQALFNFILCKNYLFLCVNICYQVLCSLRELNISETWPWLQERYRLVTDIYTTNNTNHNEVNTNYCKFKNESLTLHGVLDETSLRTELWKAWTGREEKGGSGLGGGRACEAEGSGWTHCSPCVRMVRFGVQSTPDRAEVRKGGWRGILEGLECLPCPKKFILNFLDT